MDIKEIKTSKINCVYTIADIQELIIADLESKGHSVNDTTKFIKINEDYQNNDPGERLLGFSIVLETQIF